jgi:hypothetical protein
MNARSRIYLYWLTRIVEVFFTLAGALYAARAGSEDGSREDWEVAVTLWGAALLCFVIGRALDYILWGR